MSKMLDKFLDLINWYYIEDCFKNWFYPGYYLKNMLFHRYNTIKVPKFKSYEYVDEDSIMFYSNMELIKRFMQSNPEKYVCWYKDDRGVDVGHKYGDCRNAMILFPEYKNKYIMDIIKEIYNWYTNELPVLEKDYDYLLKFWSDNFCGEMKFDDDDNDDEDEMSLHEMFFDKTNCATSFETLKNADWKVLDKYIPDRMMIFKDERYVADCRNKLEFRIFKEKQKYLHLCIEIRPYLWT